MRVVTLNVNDIRSAAKRGLCRWLAAQRPELVCLQETRALEIDLDEVMRAPKGLHGHFCAAQKKGYAGVALYSRAVPDRIVRGFGAKEFDAEGRYLEARFGKLSVVSVYFPSSSAGPQRQAAKFRFLYAFLTHLKKLRKFCREVILCGDWNVAHHEIDLKNWRANRRNPGLLPEERAWLTRIFDEAGFVNMFRRLNAKPEQYTWWSNRGLAWAKSVGWRIDYQGATPGMTAKATKESIYRRGALLGPRAADDRL